MFETAGVVRVAGTEPLHVADARPVEGPLQASSSADAALAQADALGAATVRLAALVTEARSWSEADRRTVLGRLDRALDRLAAARATVLVAERECGRSGCVRPG
ncbi:hypothetical protein [uncultured Cellulomonas sp.]|uniref:hypothetical protein n=1 Tax=uncultured Cellulomonas sp. TaxID=189682 RepID=UPI002609D457|nr:hypothetical protein [uncultured Cellulomonas sp.]